MEEEEEKNEGDWKKKYILLENSLQTFREQASKIRDVLKQKVSVLIAGAMYI